MSKITIAFALAAAAFAAPANAQPLSAAEIARIDQAVTRHLAETSVPSASIAVVRDGKIVLAKAYGKANEGLPASPALPYQIASISKQFTAMALLLLEDDGKLDLDDTVSKYLPNISGGDQITLRQLLSHTSGLQDYWPQDYSFAAMARPTTPQAIADRWAKKPLDFQPGEQWQYSNTGYVVAGMIAEKVSGEPLLQFMKRRLFDPAGMASVISQDDAVGRRFPSGYGRNALGPVRPVVVPGRGWLYAAGELSMTAEDLAKWDIARLNRSLVPADDWAEQETTIKLNSGVDSNYGLGVFARDANGRRVIAHGGEAVGFLSNNAVYPRERAAIVVLTNSWSGGASGRIARDLAAIVLPAPPADQASVTAAARARTLLDQLASGRVDRSLLTENANYYFTPQALADYRASLAPLGTPTALEPRGSPTLRGGFAIQGYTIKYPTRTLDLSTFYEPGGRGRIEQFLITPGE
ncbi:beta-lactamase family protein [Sphingomonas sinipercae]|uniref:Beta-lactamase family protein n=1 Tax=Sphingomonas sinipercae TaxID=2714944 RepID=A0A6G7ZMY8_9SPHN|nr:serine hydrolase domain-containing protein [Sphingomonas sinipercae]QIL02288.1 beta-lactamase family protein [Sphingomonas sinipercae]